MKTSLKDIPGYIIIIGLAAVIALAFGATHIFGPHKTAFEKETGYQKIDDLIAAKIAFQEQVERQILEMGENGDDYKKAEAGDAEAQYHIGIFYLYGSKSQPSDLTNAMEWLRKSAAQNYARAEYQIGRMYANGFSVTQNQKEALRRYRIAADEGYSWAQIHLGEIYLNFLAEQFGAQRDFSEAYFWLFLGTREEDPFSDFIRDRDDAGSRLTKEQKIATDRRVQEWLKTHPSAAAK